MEFDFLRFTLVILTITVFSISVILARGNIREIVAAVCGWR